MSDRSCHSGTVRAGWIESCREIAMKPSMVPFDRTGPSTGSGQTGQDMPFVVTWSNHERIARSQAHPLTGSGQARAHHERMVGRVCHGPALGSTGSPRTGLGAHHERAWELATNGPGSSPRTEFFAQRCLTCSIESQDRLGLTTSGCLYHFCVEQEGGASCLRRGYPHLRVAC